MLPMFLKSFGNSTSQDHMMYYIGTHYIPMVESSVRLRLVWPCVTTSRPTPA
jgi:hypothetical protein